MAGRGRGQRGGYGNPSGGYSGQNNNNPNRGGYGNQLAGRGGQHNANFSGANNAGRGDGGGGGGGGQQNNFKPGGYGNPSGNRAGPHNNNNFGGRGRGSVNDQRGGRGRGTTQPEEQEEIVYTDSNSQPGPADPRLIEAEDQFMSEAKTALSLSGVSLRARMPPRPDYGTIGGAFTVYANYRQIHCNPKARAIHEYSISIKPVPRTEGAPSNRSADIPTKKRQRIIQLMLSTTMASMKDKFATDYSGILISMIDIPPDKLEQKVVHLLQNEHVPTRKSVTYEITLEKVRSFRVSELIADLSKPDQGVNEIQKAAWIQALSIIMHHSAKSRSLGVGASIMAPRASRYYAINNTIDPTTNNYTEGYSLGSLLEAWRGFFSSVRPATGRLLLNTQVKYAAAYKPQRLTEVIDTLMRHYGDLRRVEKFLRRVRVEATHESNQAKPQRVIRPKFIIGLARPPGPNANNPTWRVPFFGATPSRVEFMLKNAQGVDIGRVSVAKYFKDKYRPVSDRYPVLNVGSKDDPTFLPADVCTILPGQPADAQLTPDETAAMIEFAVNRPAANARKIVENSLALLGMASAPDLLENFGLRVHPALVRVPARAMQAPRIEYGGNKPVDVNSGEWNMKNVKFKNSATLDNWTVMFLRSCNNNQDYWTDMQGFFTPAILAFRKQLQTAGMTVHQPNLGVNGDEPIEVFVDQRDSADALFKKIDAGFQDDKMTARRPKSLLVLMSVAHTEIYNQLKVCGDLKYGIHTVAVVGSKFVGKKHEHRPQPTYFANVGLKFNLKLGGRNQAVQPADLGIISQGKTMVVGLDVTHPSPGSVKDAPSVVGIVASIDSTMAQFPGDLDSQTGRQEEIANLEPLMIKRLRLWQKNNNLLPENILIYRDGVSEGQYYNTVVEKELPPIRRACELGYGASFKYGVNPRITIVIVGKRHNTRLYPMPPGPGQDMKGSLFFDQATRNVVNGTVVDRGITEARNWDFFLVAHKALKGTARPAHYYVVLDEIFRNLADQGGRRSADALQELTYNMCYMFGRATKAVSICPPAYYADIICTRARCYKSRLYDPNHTDSEAGDDEQAKQAKEKQEKEEKEKGKKEKGKGKEKDEKEKKEESEGKPKDEPGKPDNVEPENLVHANLKDTMFYI